MYFFQPFTYFLPLEHFFGFPYLNVLPCGKGHVLSFVLGLCFVFLSCFCSVLMEGLVTPLQDRIEEWKKTANQLDKDHAKGTAARSSRNLFMLCVSVNWKSYVNFFPIFSSQNTKGPVRKLKESR